MALGMYTTLLGPQGRLDHSACHLMLSAGRMLWLPILW